MRCKTIFARSKGDCHFCNGIVQISLYHD
jgi:hypothetical protein